MPEPPFLYDRPTTYTFGAPTDRPFNPRAATQASWTQYRVPKPQRNGPLIDFNKHPDSYLVVPYGNLNVKPMGPKTKDRVHRARAVQLFLRICALLGAIGLLFCVIAINKTAGTVGWIIRAAPAVALCHSVYGVYHLCRSATGRTAASTASYMVFAAMVDTGLIPFFGFTAFLAQTDYTRNVYGWSTLFDDNVITYKIIYAFFLLTCTEGGLLVLSLFLDVYLATMFRKIAKLPPDMNPLEPNLTARPSAHKRNKSSMNITEKHMSGSTLASQNLSSGIGGKRVPFIHTRTDSADSVTLYGNESARNSRKELRKDLAEQERDPYRASANSSRVTLAPTRPSSVVSPNIASRSPGTGMDHRPNRSSGLANAQSPTKASSWLSYMDYEGMPTELSNSATKELDREVRPISPVSKFSSRSPSLDRVHAERANWYSNNLTTDQPQAVNTNSRGHLYTNGSAIDLDRYETAPTDAPQSKRSREPLAMNPPTPPTNPPYDENATPHGIEYQTPPSYSHSRPVLSDTDGNVRGRPSNEARAASFVGSGGKSRYYGNLRSSMIASNGSLNKDHKEGNVEVHGEDDDNQYDYERTKTMQSASDYSANFEVYNSNSDSDEELDNRERGHAVVYSQPNNPWNGHRQTSNTTGVDLNSSYAGLAPEFGAGMGRRREVSGKVAEEGRSPGFGGLGITEMRTGTVNSGHPVRNAAAGWARFGGL